jgi:selenocysteine lyase/cysteine desulfurase
VILDAAAFVPTNRLDLARVHPDFVPISFYKMFGYPTGVGALIARRLALEKLHRPWFAGGTITVASVQGDRFYLAEGPAAFEDGTLNYLMLPAVEIGLRHIQAIGLDMIHTRVTCLAGWVLDALASLRHANGERLVRVYGPVDTDARGGTLAMNFYGPGGHPIDHRAIEHLANAAGISLRTGCFCNPGEGEVALGLSKDELVTCFARGSAHYTLDEFRACIDTKSTGAVRVSLGLVSNFEDVWRFMEFARGLLDRPDLLDRPLAPAGDPRRRRDAS